MNDNTVLKDFIGNGYLGNFSNSVGDMGLNGGGFIELPGCATAYRDICGSNICGGPQEYYYYAKDNELSGNTYPHWKEWWYTGHGKGISNVLVKNIRVNDMQHQLDCSNNPSSCNHRPNAVWPLVQLYTNTLFWNGLAIDDSPHKNIHLRHIFSGITFADGINVHGKVDNFNASHIHIENTHDDGIAIWGVNSDLSGNNGSIPCDNSGYCLTRGPCKGQDLSTCTCKNIGSQLGTNINFNDITIRIDESNLWGRCIGIFGSQDANINNFTCYDTSKNREVVRKLRTYCGAGSDKLNLQFKNISYYDVSLHELCGLNSKDTCNAFNNKIKGTIKDDLYGNQGSALGVDISPTKDGFNITLNSP